MLWPHDLTLLPIVFHLCTTVCFGRMIFYSCLSFVSGALAAWKKNNIIEREESFQGADTTFGGLWSLNVQQGIACVVHTIRRRGHVPGCRRHCKKFTKPSWDFDLDQANCLGSTLVFLCSNHASWWSLTASDASFLRSQRSRNRSLA